MTEEILQKLAEVETVEELNAVLEANNIPLEEGVTPEAFLAAMKSDSDELNEDALDDVAGGTDISWAMRQAAKKLCISIALYIKKYLRKR